MAFRIERLEFNAQLCVIQILESRKLLVAETGILGFGIQNSAQEIRNCTNNKLESTVPDSTVKESRIQYSIPESKTVFDYLISGGEGRGRRRGRGSHSVDYHTSVCTSVDIVV